jgi:NAD(P)-dependent dehydrogenase (short-subunit alcohol dehydrogenase family)
MKQKMNIVMTGGSSGLGESIIGKIYESHKNNVIWRELEVNIFNIDLHHSKYSLEEKTGNFNVHDIIFDLTSPEYLFTELSEQIIPDKVDILINNCGVNYIEWIEKIDMLQYDFVMDVNVKAPTLLVKHNLNKLRDGTILNIISNASDMAMTNSLVYNGSKGAMKIITKQMSRELGKTHNITVFGISPNKIGDTEMSKYIDHRVCELRGWTEEEAKKYQVESLPTRKETNKETLAEFIVFLLSSKQRHEYLQGCILPYGAPMSN